MSRSTYRRSMDFLTLHRRLAIYHRDHFDCVWCAGEFPPNELGYGLQIDHLGDRSDHRSESLVTSCGDCNARKKAKPVEVWLGELATEGHDIDAVRERLARARTTPLDMAEGVRLALLRRPRYVGHLSSKARKAARAAQPRPGRTPSGRTAAPS